MKNKNYILALGILIAFLILFQLYFSTPKRSDTATTTLSSQISPQKNLMVNTAIVYVISFINHN